MNNARSFTLVRLVFLALLAASLSAGLASAQNYKGQFTLPFEARWGVATLPPGDYSFRLDTAVAPYMAHIQREGQTVAMIMANGGSSDSSPSERSQLIVVRHGKQGTIRALQLAEAGRAFFYTVPKAERQLLAQAPELIQRIPITMTGK